MLMLSPRAPGMLKVGVTSASAVCNHKWAVGVAVITAVACLALDQPKRLCYHQNIRLGSLVAAQHAHASVLLSVLTSRDR